MYQTETTTADRSAEFQQPAVAGRVAPQVCQACASCGGPPSRQGKRTALWWGLAGTLLSGLGWIALMLFEQYNAGLAELRNDLKNFHEARADLVKKESLHKLYERFQDFIREMQASTTAREMLERQLHQSERSRRVMARDLQRIRERLASVEGRQAATTVAVPLGAGER